VSKSTPTSLMNSVWLQIRTICSQNNAGLTEEWRRLHNGELHALYFSPNIIRAIKSRREMGSACSTFEEEARYIQGFGGEI
jgi:hypothetical protein